nr:serine protease [Pedobacter panaciterrae]
MSSNQNIKAVLFLLLVVFLSCKKKVSPDADKPLQGKVELAKLEEVLNGNDQNLIKLLNKVRGSVGKRGPASKTVWSRKNEYGLGLYISANHVYSLSGWTSRSAQFFDLSSENPGIFETSQIPPINGNIALGNTLIADFPLMHFDISTNATNTTVLPAEDFYLGVVDNQRIEQGSFPQYPGVVQTTTPLQMYDPNNRTKTNQTWNSPVVGEKAIAIGYPQDKANYSNGAVAYGKILSDEEAIDTIQKLKTAGDTEADISYNPEVEFFVAAQAITGMSGGGVFNSDGQLLGIMVRSSNKEKAPKIIRVVKVSYIKSKMTGFYNSLSETSKQKIGPFITGEL